MIKPRINKDFIRFNSSERGASISTKIHTYLNEKLSCKLYDAIIAKTITHSICTKIDEKAIAEGRNFTDKERQEKLKVLLDVLSQYTEIYSDETEVKMFDLLR